MEHRIQACAAFPTAGWVEHFEWLEGLFEDRLEIAEGQMRVPMRPSNGYTLRAQARDWTVANATFGEIDGP